VKRIAKHWWDILCHLIPHNHRALCSQLVRSQKDNPEIHYMSDPVPALSVEIQRGARPLWQSRSLKEIARHAR
jgi:hypothetical protein